MIIAIQPDNYGPNDASSPLWTLLLSEAGFQVKEVNVYRSDILDQLKGCSGFMWRYGHIPQMKQIARRLLPIIENELKLTVYPNQSSCWHYDDKVAQSYLFQAMGIPSPKTWIWFNKGEAISWAQTTEYPIVIKLSSGAGSTNVRLVNSPQEANHWIGKLFDNGASDLNDNNIRIVKRFLDSARIILKGNYQYPWDTHKEYVFFQEFIADNKFDTRITVIGNRAFGFRRFNRENDFRASGSGIIDYNPKNIESDVVKFAFNVAKKLKMQSCAVDVLRKGSDPVVSEISYTYASWAVHECHGHWDSEMYWHEGQMWPEEAQIEDFLVELKKKKSSN